MVKTTIFLCDLNFNFESDKYKIKYLLISQNIRIHFHTGV
jgi:hypothetical protein